VADGDGIAAGADAVVFSVSGGSSGVRVMSR
jgi:hypothetical protein